MPGPFGSGAFGTAEFSSSPLFTTASLIDSVLRDTGHSSPSAETTKRTVVLGFINNTYARVTTSKHWDWLFSDTDMNFETPYETGTIAVTSGSATITGTGTNWSALTIPHWKVIIKDEIYAISSVNSPTSITLESEYAQDTASGLSYKIVKSIYQLPADCEHAQSIVVDRVGEMVPMGVQEFRRKTQYDPVQVGSPRFFTEVGRRSEDGLRYIEVYPSPDQKYQAHMDYGVNIMKLTDSATSYPLIPDRYRVVLYYGALAEMYRYLRDAASEATAKADFNRVWLSMQGDQQMTDSKLILARAKTPSRRRRHRLSMDTTDFSRYE